MKLPVIERITLLTGSGPDKVILHFDLPPTTYPFDDERNKPTATIDVAANQGLEWIRKTFGAEPESVIRT